MSSEFANTFWLVTLKFLYAFKGFFGAQAIFSCCLDNIRENKIKAVSI